MSRHEILWHAMDLMNVKFYDVSLIVRYDVSHPANHDQLDTSCCGYIFICFVCTKCYIACSSLSFVLIFVVTSSALIFKSCLLQYSLRSNKYILENTPFYDVFGKSDSSELCLARSLDGLVLPDLALRLTRFWIPMSSNMVLVISFPSWWPPKVRIFKQYFQLSSILSPIKLQDDAEIKCYFWTKTYELHLDNVLLRLLHSSIEGFISQEDWAAFAAMDKDYRLIIAEASQQNNYDFTWLW
jgi:hypothetical protein